MNNKFICAGVTLYNPKKSDIENLKYYSGFFEKIYVYDNTQNFHITFAEEKIEIISYGANDGLAIACSKLCEKAKKDNYEYIMLFDQDSRITIDSLILLCRFIKKNREIATIYCPRIVFNGKNNKQNKNEYTFVKWCITSGSVINLTHYGKEYKFDENYFIDRLDKDLCEQVIRSGKKICQVNAVVMQQQLGEMEKNGYFSHMPFRHYYIARNRLYFNRKFGKSKLTTVLETARHAYIIIRNEPKKKQKLKMLLRGISDYRRGKMGSI